MFDGRSFTKKQSKYLRSEFFYRFPVQMHKTVIFILRTSRASRTPGSWSICRISRLPYQFSIGSFLCRYKSLRDEKIAIRRLHILALVMPSARIDKTILQHSRNKTSYHSALYDEYRPSPKKVFVVYAGGIRDPVCVTRTHN